MERMMIMVCKNGDNTKIFKSAMRLLLLFISHGAWKEHAKDHVTWRAILRWARLYLERKIRTKLNS